MTRSESRRCVLHVLVIGAMLQGGVAVAQMLEPSAGGGGGDPPRRPVRIEPSRAESAVDRIRRSGRSARAAAAAAWDTLRLMGLMSATPRPPPEDEPQGPAGVVQPALAATHDPASDHAPATEEEAVDRLQAALGPTGAADAAADAAEQPVPPLQPTADPVVPPAPVEARVAQLMAAHGIQAGAVVVDMPPGAGRGIFFEIDPTGPHQHQGVAGHWRSTVHVAATVPLPPPSTVLDRAIGWVQRLVNRRYYELSADGRFLVPRSRPL
jgi:hypothetical protein